MVGFPHPERFYPRALLEIPVIVPHTITNGKYIAKFQPLGRNIAVVTQYPEGFNGLGPNVASERARD